MTKALDLVVIGSGPGGYRAAVRGALRGLRVAIVERAVWGGCCLNRGCVPKKDWYHSARLLSGVRHYGGRGLTGALTGDLEGAWHHQREVVARVRQSYLDYLERLGVTRLEGSARFTGPRALTIEGAHTDAVDAAHIIIATGSSPMIPGLFAGVPRVLTTDDLFQRGVPSGRRVALVGGGVIGAELAYILTRLGCEISWITRRPPLAHTRLSAPARAALTAAFKREGVDARERSVREVTNEGSEVRLSWQEGGSELFDWVVLATGRRAETGGLDPGVGGIELTRDGAIKVQEGTLMTSADGVLAIGDCVGDAMTANQALADGTAAIDAIVDGASAVRDPRRVPEVIYSAIEIARIGLDDEGAEDAGHEPAIGFAAFETSPKALGEDEPDGFVRLIADMDTGAFLGGEVVGAEAGEMVQLLTLAQTRGLAPLASLPFNHPARAEEVGNAIDTLASQWGLGAHLWGGANAASDLARD